MDIEQFILHILIKYSELDYRELLTKVAHNLKLGENYVIYLLNVLKDHGLIEFIEKTSDAYEKCLVDEKLRSDRRIKNIKKYCKRLYPSRISVKVTDAGRVEYAHNCYCLSFKLNSTTETALLNMKQCAEYADVNTTPPNKCT